MLTKFEIIYMLMEPFLPVLYSRARKDIRKLLKSLNKNNPRILDVGGRKSHYTIGMQADIVLLDLPRQTTLQNQLNLGMDEKLFNETITRRSNIGAFYLEDMNRCSLPSDSFDGVVCIEVLEHVRTYDIFLSQIVRVLKPGGWLYLSTPNGDYIHNEPPNYNPDHFHHYTHQELMILLEKYFSSVNVVYGIKTGRYRMMGLKAFNFNQPVQFGRSALANIINRYESNGLDHQPKRTAHLFAKAWKQKTVPI